MTWPYNPSIPNPPNDPADDVSGMQTNASSIASLIAIDHVPFNVAGGGQHEQVTFNANNVPTPPVSPPVLFTNTVAGLPQLFFYSGDAAHSSNQYVASGNGSTMLLGGIILKWGAATITSGNSSVNVTFASAFPNTAFVVNATCTISFVVGDLEIRCDNLNQTGFRLNRQGTPAANATYYYIAIGN